ncbi:MAG: hypothetical protein WBS20_05060 [Lysobacterales bacterium]
MNRMNLSLRLATPLFFLLGTMSALAMDWPQEITAPEGTIVVYQPQPETLEGNILTGRAAISLQLSNKDEQVFGAMWFSAQIDTDTDTSVVIVRNVKVEKVSWPDSKDAGEQRFTAIVEAAVPESGFEISLEQLSSSLETAKIEQKSLENLKMDPPEIVFSETLTVLMLFEGKPRFSPIENSRYESAVNTPFAVARNAKTGMCYLSSGTYWYEAKDPMGPWAPTSSPPDDLKQMIQDDESEAGAPSTPPAVLAVSVPTELIVSAGKPNWKTLPGGDLLYVENTETPWLRELSTNNMYVLLSGRWYRSKSQSGPWTFVRSDELPPSFSDIPPDSDIGGLRVSVAGTDEAEDALMDAAIPQTAAIKRSEASLTVEYDGQPKFEKIEGTDVKYAVNTAAQVLEISGKYYAVDNGVWFTAGSAGGPWVVADSIPNDEIKTIPPSSPVYNTTYVQVYQSTPEVVYVGYTPGYMWSYPYYGVPVYGTGWYYPPYMGRYYYPRPPTWGLHVGYNPWTGWNFGVSWGYGFLRVGMVWGGGYHHRYHGCCGGGWYGGGYRGGNNVIINTGDINIGNKVNIGNRNNVNNRMASNNSRNIYDRPENRKRNADKATVKRDLQQARPANRKNNVFADKNGNVARKTKDGWESRSDGAWKSDKATSGNLSPANRDRATQQARDRVPQAKPTQARPTQTRPSIDRQGLNNANQARQRGATREMSRPAPRAQHGRRR